MDEAIKILYEIARDKEAGLDHRINALDTLLNFEREKKYSAPTADTDSELFERVNKLEEEVKECLDLFRLISES